MKSRLNKERRNRKIFALEEKKMLLYKSLYKNEFLLSAYRNMAFLFLSKQKKSFVLLRNYCVLSGRSRGLVHKYNISRMHFKKFANFGYLSGVSKSSW